VKAELIRQGVNASRITTDAKGDTVQPFAENDQNRVVIAICEEK
jgi:outer membrane protein OmpA-like peptidoglycan-associated protein